MFSTYRVVDHRRDDLIKNAGHVVPRGDLPSDPFDRYLTLPVPENKIVATYVWIDGSGETIRCKDRTLDYLPKIPQIKDKFADVMRITEKKIIDDTFIQMEYSQYEKYLPPYYCPINLEKNYKVECKIREERNMNCFDENLKDLPILGYDGNATQQARRRNSDMYMIPRAIYRNPFRGGNHILVMCDTYNAKMQPSATNHRAKCLEAYKKCKVEEPWFGIEQEFYFMNLSDARPLGWPKGGFPPRSHYYDYYCGIGADKIFGRDLIEAHYRSCIYAGIPIWGSNAETGPSQWEYQIGPSVGVDAGDDVWMARFIMEALAEEYGVLVSLDPKPVKNWNGSGAHINFSFKKSRAVNGIKEIEKAIAKLKEAHLRDIKVSDPHGGKDNAKRLDGTYEASSMTVFTAGIKARECSVRIPGIVAKQNKGYFEDRRPGANCDPYAVTGALMRTCLLNE